MPFLHKVGTKHQSNKYVKIKLKNGYHVTSVKPDFIYEGGWKEDLKHNFGLLSTKSNKSLQRKYQGYWKYDRKSGKGNGFYDKGGYYVGDWRCSKRHGYGSMWYADGSFYDGDWVNNMRHGSGIFVQANGNRYEGKWKDNCKHGQGRFFFLDTGQMQEGVWENGYAVQTIMRDIPFRQSVFLMTQYPIPRINEVHHNIIVKL